MILGYCSFANEKFLGAYILEAGDLTQALFIINWRGHNPGGECAFVLLPDDMPVPPKRFWNRLLDKREANKAFSNSGGVQRHRDATPEQRSAMESHAQRVCARCNKP